METKNKKPNESSIIIPEGIDIRIERSTVFVKGEKGEVQKEFKEIVKIEKIDNKIVLKTDTDRRRIRAVAGAAEADIKNMIKGVTKGVTYKMRVVYSHFPINLKLQGNSLLIENFLGEKYPRKAKILEGVKVNIKGRDIEVQGINKELVAQTAANIESATAITKWDPRVFQDGIYIHEKDGKSLLR